MRWTQFREVGGRKNGLGVKFSECAQGSRDRRPTWRRDHGAPRERAGRPEPALALGTVGPPSPRGASLAQTSLDPRLHVRRPSALHRSFTPPRRPRSPPARPPTPASPPPGYSPAGRARTAPHGLAPPPPSPGSASRTP